MFKKILIANRGEIACRVAATAQRLGVKTVAVYSDADAHAKHVAACDEAVHIGGCAPNVSYLRWEKIIEAAQGTGAQAVHPGYGFLSENEDFAKACAAAGLVFIGPPASAIKAMGLKAESKQLMEKAGVPCAAVNDIGELARTEQMEASKLIQQLPGGPKVVGLPIAFDHVRPHSARSAPTLGEHTDEVLGSLPK
jgi:acetyl/propionyl-CoA carboxylase alpha subunit